MRNDTPLVAFADFVALRRAGEEPAVHLLQRLLLDETACRLRIAWLREAVAQARARFPDLGERPRPEFLERVLDAVTAPGALAAWRDGTVTFPELEALTRAPRALYEAHCRLLGLEPGPWGPGEGDLVVLPEVAAGPLPGDGEGPAASPSQFTSLTSMSALLGRADYERFRQRLERYPLLPDLLEAIELDRGLDRQLLHFIQDQCRRGRPEADVIETMIGWLRAFAVAQHARREVRLSRGRFASIVRRVIVRGLLEEARGDEPFEVAFRDAALERLRQDFGSAREVVQALKAIRVSVAPGLEEDYVAYRGERLRSVQGALLLAERIWGLAG
jgi:hypothetical protein